MISPNFNQLLISRKTVQLCLLTVSVLLFEYCSGNRSAERATEAVPEAIYELKTVADSIYDSSQRVSILTLNKASSPVYSIDIAWLSDTLLPTSQIAENRGALAAINGSFFNMDSGGSVSYLEMNDSLISRTRQPGLKWAVADSIINGALLLDKSNILMIEAAKSESYYEESPDESFVLVSGPLLIKNSKAQKLPDMNFTHMRHPRTCIGITKESIIFIVIDGRSVQAAGMSLPETQEYLMDLGCIDAINLDGGGSSCMWTQNLGIVNKPSDKTGERSVANAVIIFEKQAL